MSTQMSPKPGAVHDSRNGIIAGVVLIVIGALLIVAQFGRFEDIGLLIPLGLGIVFLAWGLITRTFGLIIPGGILAGIGFGAALTEMTALNLPAENADSVILLSFAAGWFLIALLSKRTAGRWHWWPLIPGGILGAVGVLLLAGESGLQVLIWLGYLWPLALIGAGIYLVYRFAARKG
ncbi:MAG: hypothetical protein J5I90_19210 [Caldilineales bacterium]|nr:hypothetical protein [Caldilineales bacterium]